MTKAKKISKKQLKRLLSKNPRRRSRRPKSRRKPKRTKLSMYSRMLADPCGSALVPGIFGTAEGLMSRHRTTNIFMDTNGYFAWCPHFHSGSGTTASSNHSLFYYTNVTTSTNPINSTANPLGTTSGTSGVFYSDPAYNFVNGTTCADARLISACMTLIYTGSVSGCAGEVAYIPNLASSALLYGGSGGLPMSIDDVFSCAPVIDRVQLDAMEFIHHPGSVKPAFKSAAAGALYYQGAATGPTQITSMSEGAGMPGWSVIAWRGTNSNMRVELTKTVEWRPEPNVGIVSQTPRTLMAETTYTDALKQLDNMSSKWWFRLTDAIGQGMGNSARAALQNLVFGGGGVSQSRDVGFSTRYSDL